MNRREQNEVGIIWQKDIPYLYFIHYDVVVLPKYLWLNQKDANWEVVWHESTFSFGQLYLNVYYVFPWSIAF